MTICSLGGACAGNAPAVHPFAGTSIAGESSKPALSFGDVETWRTGAAILQRIGTFRSLPGFFFGLGLGGFFDGIVLHQLVQWHHVLSSWYPVNTIENLELNTRWDGIFHSATYLFVVAALFILWRTAQGRHLYWSTKLLTGIIGFGAFNVVEGIINHHLLGLHHVNEVVGPDFRI